MVVGNWTVRPRPSRSRPGWFGSWRPVSPPGARGAWVDQVAVVQDLENLDDDVAHLAALDDEVEHAVLEQELGALEPFGQLLADGLLDDARAGEADERLRL